jgi:hypothetical protein
MSDLGRAREYSENRKERRRAYVTKKKSEALEKANKLVGDETLKCQLCDSYLGVHVLAVCGQDEHVLCGLCCSQLQNHQCPYCRGIGEWDEAEVVAKVLGVNEEISQKLSGREKRAFRCLITSIDKEQISALEPTPSGSRDEAGGSRAVDQMQEQEPTPSGSRDEAGGSRAVDQMQVQEPRRYTGRNYTFKANSKVNINKFC